MEVWIYYTLKSTLKKWILMYLDLDCDLLLLLLCCPTSLSILCAGLAQDGELVVGEAGNAARRA